MISPAKGATDRTYTVRSRTTFTTSLATRHYRGRHGARQPAGSAIRNRSDRVGSEPSGDARGPYGEQLVGRRAWGSMARSAV